MRRIIVGLLMLAGCAPQRITVRQMQDYDQAILLAESQGMDTAEMHKHLVDMVIQYMKDPGEDEYTIAARKAAQSMEWNAAANIYNAVKPIPVYQQPPMSFNQWRGR